MFLNDLKRIKKLGKYLTKIRKQLSDLIVLLPVSFAGAIQPLLVGRQSLFLKKKTQMPG